MKYILIVFAVIIVSFIPSFAIEIVIEPQPLVKAKLNEEDFSGVKKEIISTTSIYCYCIKAARNEGVDIPYSTDAGDLKPNVTPQVGALALFLFPPNKEYPNGVPHVALIDEMNAGGFHVRQGNKISCEYSEEWISWENPYLAGFWKKIEDVDK